MEDPDRKLDAPEFARQEREKEATQDGVYRSDPWVQGWKGFIWLVNKPLFKVSLGSEADVLAYAEMKHESPETWKDEFTISFGDDGFWTGSLYFETLKAAWAEIWFHVSLINIRPLYFKMTFPNYDAYEKYDFNDYGTEDELRTCVGWYTDVDIAPIHGYVRGSVGSCVLSFVEKMWHREDPLKIHCGFDNNTVMRTDDILLFRGWRGTWALWDMCFWL